ncbi:MAG: hypothetical protein ACTSPY_12365 [Candidatus Helarchaeota archaeon]
MSDHPKLTKNELKLLEIIQDFSKNNDKFTLNEIILHCKNNIKLSDKKIIKIIEDFIQKKLIIRKKELIKDDILNNDERYKIYEFISKNPGLEFITIIKEFDLNPKILRWHLEFLKKFGYIREKKYLIYELYYHKYFPRDKDIQIFLLRNKDIYNVYTLLRKAPLSSRSISEILNIRSSLIQYYLTKLVHENLIIINKDNKYSINQDNESFLKDYFNLEISKEIDEKLTDFNELKKLSYLIIMNKESGIMLYQHNFIEVDIDADLVSGFLTAIQQFGSELKKESSIIKKIEYKGFEINIEDGNWVRTALIINGTSSKSIEEMLTSFVKLYENEYSRRLIKWTGDVSIFEDSKVIIEDFFTPKTTKEKNLIQTDLGSNR